MTSSGDNIVQFNAQPSSYHAIQNSTSLSCDKQKIFCGDPSSKDKINRDKEGLDQINFRRLILWPIHFSNPAVGWQVGRSPQICSVTDFEMETSNFVLFLLISVVSPIFGLYIMKQYTVKLGKLFSQFYLLFFVFLMCQHNNGDFREIVQRRASISKKTSFRIMVMITYD